jgi:hypothetical protein
MAHMHNTIFRFLQNSVKYSSVNLHKNNPFDHMFFDQMKVASQLEIAPKLELVKLYPMDVKKIIFQKVQYFDIIKPPFQLNEKDCNYIFSLHKMLHRHGKFIPTTPYLGFKNYQDIRKWYIWSYTPIHFMDCKNQYLEGLYRFGYLENPLLRNHVVYPMLDYLSDI